MNYFKEVPVDVIKKYILPHLYGKNALRFFSTCKQMWYLFPDPVDRILFYRGSRNVVKVPWKKRLQIHWMF